MLGREVLQPIDLMLNPGCDEEQRTPGTYAARHQEKKLLIERPGKNYSNLNDARKGIMICVWKKENTL